MFRSVLSGCASLVLLVSSGVSAAPLKCQRLISLAPSMTESLFALELGPRVRGVTRYCNFPPEAKSLPRLGGLFDTNLEAALMLSPDLVVGLPESSPLLSKFEQLGISTLTASDRGIEELYESFIKICDACGCQEKAAQLIADLQRQVETVVLSRKGRPERTAALLVASSISGETQELFVSGIDGFYSSALQKLRARNVFENKTSALPSSSLEGFATLRPEVIFLVEANKSQFEKVGERLKELLPHSKLIRLEGDYVMVPGPRFPRLLADMASGLNSF